MLFTLFIITVTASGPQVDSQESSERQISALIEDLGDRRFQVRQKATRELTERGREAIGSLRDALKNQNPEIRRRAKSILATVLGTETRAGFLKEPTVENARQVPGWKRLRPLFDSDKQATQALADWLRAEPQMFEAQIVGGREFADEFSRRVAFLSDFLQANTTETSKQREQLMHSVHAAIFLAATSSARPPAAIERACDTLFGIRIVARQLLQPKSLTFKLANEWVKVPGSQYPRLLLTLKYGLPAGLPLAEKIVREKARGPRMEYALHVIGKLGNEKQIPLLKQQLSNTIQLSRRRTQAIRGPAGSRLPVKFEYQVRDIALAMLWHLSGEHPSDHGFGPRVRDHKWFVFSPGTMGFASSEDRNTAFAEWKNYKAGK